MVIAGARAVPLYRPEVPPDAGAVIGEVLDSGAIAGGALVERFEVELGRFVGGPPLVSTSDVSGALALALRTAGIGPGDEVLCAPVACLATTMPVAGAGARLVWCDMDPATATLDLDDAARRITARTRAVLAFHWAGWPCDLDALYVFARAHGLRVVEDAGEALGASWRGRCVGAAGGDLTVFSFNAVRHLTTIDGGALAAERPGDAERARWLRKYNIHQPTFRDARGEIDPTSDIVEPGIFSVLSQPSAALGLLQVSALPARVARRRANAAALTAELSGVPGVRPLATVPGADPSPWVFTVLAERRDALLDALRGRGLGCSQVHVRNDVYSVFGPPATRLAGVDEFSARTLSVPCGPWVGPGEIARIGDAFRAGW